MSLLVVSNGRSCARSACAARHEHVLVEAFACVMVTVVASASHEFALGCFRSLFPPSSRLRLQRCPPASCVGGPINGALPLSRPPPAIIRESMTQAFKGKSSWTAIHLSATTCALIIESHLEKSPSVTSSVCRNEASITRHPLVLA